MKKYFAIGLVIFLAACNGNENNNKSYDPELVVPKTPTIPYTIIAEYPHDTSAYTQGLEFHNGKLYEGTGDFKTSSLRVTDYKTGRVEKKHMMGTDSIFGEGITILKDKLYQLTWESNIVYVYEAGNIDKPVKTFKWPYDGWGLTNNGTSLIISDGTSKLFFVNPDDFRLMSTVRVSDKSGPIDSINELEYVDGFIYANVYQTDVIIKIDPSNGDVVGKMEFSGTKFFADQIVPGRTDVLNGIAYDSTKKTFFITGKRWPKMFELKLN